MNKRAQTEMYILYVFAAIFLVLTIGLVVFMINPVLQDTTDVLLPAIGEATGSIPNVPPAVQGTINATGTMVDSLNWIFGVMFVIAIITIFGLAVASNITKSKLLMGLWLVLSIFLIIFSIFISNISEDIVAGSSDYANAAATQGLLYFFLLNSPYIFLITTFITGIIVFIGIDTGEEVF